MCRAMTLSSAGFSVPRDPWRSDVADQPSVHADLEDMAQGLDDLRERMMTLDLPDEWIDKMREAASLVWDVANMADDA